MFLGNLNSIGYDTHPAVVQTITHPRGALNPQAFEAQGGIHGGCDHGDCVYQSSRTL